VTSLAVAALIFACTFCGSLLGMAIGRRLPPHHLSDDSRDTIKRGMTLIGTMTALILGLLIASAKSAYDTQRNEVAQISARVMFLDRLLAMYGPQSGRARAALRAAVVRGLEQVWPAERATTATTTSDATSRPELDPMVAGGEALYPLLEQLAPENDAQRTLKAQALTSETDLGMLRWGLYGRAAGSAVSAPFLLIVVFWLTVIFISFGLLSPGNRTVQATLLLCAVSVAAAIFLILELDRPFDGVIRISSAPLRSALEHLGR
jgi:hypothetical protein